MPEEMSIPQKRDLRARVAQGFHTEFDNQQQFGGLKRELDILSATATIHYSKGIMGFGGNKFEELDQKVLNKVHNMMKQSVPGPWAAVYKYEKRRLDVQIIDPAEKPKTGWKLLPDMRL